jgi:hypothetical protein
MTVNNSPIHGNQQTPSVIRLTIADTGNIPVSKKVTVVDGKLHKAPSATPSNYDFKVRECSDVHEVNNILNNLTPTQFIITGLPHVKNNPDEFLPEGRIVSKEYLNDHQGGNLPKTTITRSLDCFKEGDFILIDIDNTDINFDEIPAKIIELAPELKGAPMLIRPSSSHGLSIQGEAYQSGKISAHAYVFCRGDGHQFKRVGEILSKRCWLKGIGNHIQINGCGSMLVRQLVDKAVFSPERVIYEAEAIMGENVIRSVTISATILEGASSFVELSDIKELSENQMLMYDSLVSNEKKLHQAEADNASLKDAEIKIQQAICSGVDPQKARRDVLASKRDGVLYGSQLIKFDEHGWLTVSDVLDDPVKHDQETMADPMEPEYNGGRNIAIFYANLNGNTGEIAPIIFTQAHGGRSYRLQRDPVVSETSDEILTTLSKTLRIDFERLKQSGLLNENVVEQILASSIFNPSINKFCFITHEGCAVELSETDTKKAFIRAFGLITNHEVMTDFIMASIENVDPDLSTTKKQARITATSEIPINAVIDKIKYSNQRKQLEATIDMFATQARVDLLPNAARFIFPYKPVEFKPTKVRSEIKKQIISDYKEHFDVFDDFIDFIVASRFAPDRKNAFLWIHAVSDNGKNFLMDTFAKLDLSVELSVKELEKMFDGNPVGRRMHEFINAFIVVFDEVKTVKSEIKQINNKAMLSPKFESMCTVELYAKLFLSAENIPSLAGEQGAEQQFVNRFNKFRLTNNLKNREIFKSFGSALYHDVITEYVAQEIASRVQSYISKGKDQASKDAYDFLNEFHAKHNLGHFIHSLDETVDEYAADIVTLIKAYLAHCHDDNLFVEFNYESHCNHNVFNLLKSLLIVEDKLRGKVILKSPAHFVEQYLAARVSHSSKGSLNFKISQIVEEIGRADVFYINHAGGHKSVRGVLIELD